MNTLIQQQQQQQQQQQHHQEKLPTSAPASLLHLSQQQQQHIQALTEKSDSSKQGHNQGSINGSNAANNATASVRLVPSGKVYRQLFEAQVNKNTIKTYWPLNIKCHK